MPAKSKSRPGPYLLEMRLLRDQVPSFDRFPFSVPAVRHLDTLPFHPRVTFLVGENGSGKSTLLEAIAVAVDLNPEGGSRHFNFATRASHSDLDKVIRLARTAGRPRDSYFLRAETFYNVATEIERLDREGGGPPIRLAYGNDLLHEQSHGESFFALFEHRFLGHGLYLLDEPEAALSPNRQLAFVSLLHRHCKRGSQFVIATHSPIIMAYPDAAIFLLTAEGIRHVRYESTEHYQVTKAFLNHTGAMLAKLLGEDEDGA